MEAYVILYELDGQDKRMNFNSAAHPHNAVIEEAIAYLNAEMTMQGIDPNRYRFVHVIRS
ncbi:hypothetical protein [Bacteroides thetaiotaomicron]|uniref:hypothetical protein n=1 Tax=Bacteroides thetaiotaomicron TaxID=818 RepID=UPI002164DA12|nr:hypothetical protein [Bacteroides thetaiotaomicron]UVQ25926.1 hypothetical protein NXW82_18925 [Bacteroides thetaiotaomicron]